MNGDWDSDNSSFYITISANTSTLTYILEITNENYEVDFTIANTIRTIVGFDSQIFYLRVTTYLIVLLIL